MIDMASRSDDHDPLTLSFVNCAVQAVSSSRQRRSKCKAFSPIRPNTGMGRERKDAAKRFKTPPDFLPVDVMVRAKLAKLSTGNEPLPIWPRQGVIATAILSPS